MRPHKLLCGSRDYREFIAFLVARKKVAETLRRLNYTLYKYILMHSPRWVHLAPSERKEIMNYVGEIYEEVKSKQYDRWYDLMVWIEYYIDKMAQLINNEMVVECGGGYNVQEDEGA